MPRGFARFRHSLAGLIIAALLVYGSFTAGDARASAGPVYVNCQDASGHLHAVQHPRNCNLQAIPPDLAHLVQLIDATWSGWGKGQASAEGRIRANHGEYVEGKVQFAAESAEIRLFRIRRGCRSHLFYTRLQIEGHEATLALPAGCNVHF
jgi:hypothetical protein